jgi:queuine tRNA-ribosyltransferase
VRATLLNAGFFVGQGKGSGPKAETTVAMTPAYRETQAQFTLAGKEWLSKWEKSSAKFPEELDENQKKSFEEKIKKHPQFFNRTNQPCINKLIPSLY